MGMDADIIGMGPLTPEIRKWDGLDYSLKDYAKVEDGTVITSTFFRCVTSYMSHALAQAVGIEDAYDFNQHWINPKRPEFDWQSLYEISSNEKDAETATDEVACFKACLDADWVFMFRPNY